MYTCAFRQGNKINSFPLFTIVSNYAEVTSRSRGMCIRSLGAEQLGIRLCNKDVLEVNVVVGKSATSAITAVVRQFSAYLAYWFNYLRWSLVCGKCYWSWRMVLKIGSEGKIGMWKRYENFRNVFLKLGKVTIVYPTREEKINLKFFEVSHGELTFWGYFGKCLVVS